MKKPLALLALLVLLAAAWLLTRRREPPAWSATSPAALAAFESGMEATMKYYGADAQRHFRRAAELDPSFVAPKLLLLQSVFDKQERQRLIDELRAVDLAALTERERFMVRYELASAQHREEESAEILADYLERRPNDPYALSTCSSLAWAEQDWDRAQAHYRRLLDANPNWVTAQNRLGYIAMARGRFAEAEEQFRTYVYVAPDQANPHDSLGELLTLLGRYPEAREELELALDIKPDFCITYQHLLGVWILEGLPESAADEVIERAAENCSARFAELLRCEAQLWGDLFAGRWDAPWTESGAVCRERLDPDHHLVHRLALLSGRTDVALKIEQRVAERIGGHTTPGTHRLLSGMLSHMRGVRALLTGDAGDAAGSLAAADDQFLYWGDGQGVLKLYNRLSLAYALERAGRPEESREVLADVAAVNAAFAGLYDAVRRMYRAPAPAG